MKPRLGRYLVSFFLLSLSVFTSCKKDIDKNSSDLNPVDPVTITDPVNEELNADLTSILSDTSIKASDLKFEDGSSIIAFLQQYDPEFLSQHRIGRIAKAQVLSGNEQKKLLIARMAGFAFALVQRSNWKNFQGRDQPNGLAYNWGSKNHTRARIPANWPRGSTTANVCQELLNGVDCSGMIYMMALAAGIDMGAGQASAEFLRDTTNWNGKFRLSNDYKELNSKLLKHSLPVTHPDYVDVNQIKEGDLLFKIGDGGSAIHIGMVLKNSNGDISIYQSNGKPNLGCEVNKSDTCGPRIISPSGSKAFGAGRTLFGKDWQVLRFECCPSIVKDIDGNEYSTVKIGTQCWMKTNLKTTRYRDGSAIPTGLSNAAWENTTSGAYAIYNNDAANDATYGKLYNWYAVTDSRNLCPAGWHVPTDAEWKSMEAQLGMPANELDQIGYRGQSQNVGGKLKEVSSLWQSPNVGATDESGFSGLPGGTRSMFGNYYGIGGFGTWSSSTEYSSTYAWGRNLLYGNGNSYRDGGNKPNGFSVRCLRD